MTLQSVPPAGGWAGWAAALAAGLAILAAAIPDGGFYSTDCGANFLLTRTAAVRGPTLEVELPMSSCGGRGLDAALSPLRGNAQDAPPNMFLARHGPGWKLTYPPLFPLLSALPYRLAGEAGLLLLPALGALASALLAACLAGGGGRGALVALVASPLLFYGLVFWGHAPAAACVLGGLAAMRSGRFFAAGLLVGVSVWLRTETVVAAIAAPAAWWLVRPGRETAAAAARFLAGAALLLAPLAAFNSATSGGALGTHVLAASLDPVPGGSVVAARALRLAENLLQYSVRSYRMAPELNGVVAVLLVAGLAAAAARAGSAARAVCLSLASAGGLLSAVFAGLLPGQYATGLLIVMPLAALAPLGVRASWPSLGFEAGFVLLYFAGVALLAPLGGWQWGPRYLLPLLPLLALMGLRASPLAPRSTALLLACSFCLQLAGVRDLRAQLASQRELADSLAGDAPVVTDVWFLPWQLLPMIQDRTVAFAGTPEALSLALSELERCGARSVWFLSGQWGRSQSPAIAETARRLGWSDGAARELVMPSGDRLHVVALRDGRSHPPAAGNP